MGRIRVALILAVLTAATAAWAQMPPVGSTLAKEAVKMYETAWSQWRAGQTEQAVTLMEKYISLYPTHEYVSTAYLAVAQMRRALKDNAAYMSNLEEVIKRFSGSPTWLMAYGSKFEAAKAAKDKDKFVQTLEEMARAMEALPLQLGYGYSTHWGDLFRYWYNGQMFENNFGRLGRVTDAPGWVLDIVDAADTPERAGKILVALAKTLKEKANDLSADWQYAHATLLRKAGKEDEAKKAFDDYLAGWGTDPRGMVLLQLRIRFDIDPKDAAGLDGAYEKLFKDYAGCESLEESMRGRMGALFQADRYDEFARLAPVYLKDFASGTGNWNGTVDQWVELARRRAAKDDASKVDEVVKVLDQTAGSNPARQKAIILKKLSLFMAAKKFEQAAAMAQEWLGDKYWCEQAYTYVSGLASEPAIAKALDAARTRYVIPLSNPASPAFGKLNQLKLRLKENEFRHAEEIGDEMFDKNRDDASTIEAVKLMADYYFNKVMPEPRDKWMDRMIAAYPRHPLTQAVLSNRVTSLAAAQQYEQLAKMIEMAQERFPGIGYAWRDQRMGCYDAAKDAPGRLAYLNRIYEQQISAGDTDAIYEFGRVGGDWGFKDEKATGDAWVARGRSGNPRTQIYCLLRAAGACWIGPYYYNRREGISWPTASSVNDQLCNQTLDPEVRFKAAFNDVNVLAHQGKGVETLKALEAKLTDKSYRDLSQRLDFAAVGESLGKGGLFKEGEALAKKLQGLCPSDRDAGATNLMLAVMYETGKNDALAAQYYLKLIDAFPLPSLGSPYFQRALGHLKGGACPSEIEKYLKRITNVQELVPGLMDQSGEFYLNARDNTVLAVRGRLVQRYPASNARDKLDEAVNRARK